MKRFRPRFKLIWLMVAVAVVALLYGSNASRQRHLIYQSLAEDFTHKEKAALEFARKNPNPVTKLRYWINTNKGSWEIKPKNIPYYAQMRRKYERAAWYPWLAVEADPPEPQ